MLKFSEDHEWAGLNGEICSVGISPHAVEQPGDIVFVELPEIGKIVDKGDAAAAIDPGVAVQQAGPAGLLRLPDDCMCLEPVAREHWVRFIVFRVNLLVARIDGARG